MNGYIRIFYILSIVLLGTKLTGACLCIVYCVHCENKELKQKVELFWFAFYCLTL